jgi:hypothetical protein
MHGADPVDIHKITTVYEYRKMKFKAEKIGFDLLEERIDRTTIDMLIPQSMTDLFENPEYHYQAWHFFKNYFDQQLITHVKIQIRYPDVMLVGSIVDFMQMHHISPKDISIDTCRKKYERYLKKQETETTMLVVSKQSA